VSQYWLRVLIFPPSASSSVRATPHGFLKVRDEDVHSPARKRAPDVDSSAVDEEMWKMGESYGEDTLCITTLLVFYQPVGYRHILTVIYSMEVITQQFDIVFP